MVPLIAVTTRILTSEIERTVLVAEIIVITMKKASDNNNNNNHADNDNDIRSDIVHNRSDKRNSDSNLK